MAAAARIHAERRIHHAPQPNAEPAAAPQRGAGGRPQRPLTKDEIVSLYHALGFHD